MVSMNRSKHKFGIIGLKKKEKKFKFDLSLFHIFSKFFKTKIYC